MRNFIKYWLPVYLYAGLIFYLSSQPATPFTIIPIPHIDKLAHLLEYLVLGYLLVRAFRSEEKISFLSRTTICVLAASLAFLYGITDEIHQMFVPTRQIESFDLIANLFGSSIGSVLYRKW